MTSDILAELGSDSGQAVASRLKVVRELQGQVREKRLQEQGVLRSIGVSNFDTQDLLELGGARPQVISLICR